MRLILIVYLIVMSIAASRAALASGYGADYDPNQPGISTSEQLSRYLLRAAKAGDEEIIDVFIKSGHDLNVQDSKGYTPLILSAYHGHKVLVDKLLAAGANPCQKDKRGNSALMGAVFKGELGIARQLIAARCQDTSNNVGQTPAMYAALFGRLEILEELRQNDADLDQTDLFGNSVHSLLQGEIRTR